MNVSAPSSPVFLVTGASGFTGLQLVRHLRSQNIPVRAMVRDDRSSGELKSLGAEVVRADLEDRESLRSAVQGVSGIYHIAAAFRQASLPESKYFEINVEGTRCLLDLAIEAGVKRFIHCSTVGVLSHVANPPADETAPYNPADVYQESKMEGEKLAMRYFSEGKIRGAVIRPAMIYGPGDTRTLKMFKMIANRSFFYVGNGESFVHFIDVRDLARSFHLAMEKEDINAQIYIISGRKALKLKELAEIIAEKIQVRPPWLHLPVVPMQLLGSLCEVLCKPFGVEPPIFRRRVDFFTKNRFFTSVKAEVDLGFYPEKSLEEELDDIINSYIDRGLIKAARPVPSSEALILRDIDGGITFWDRNAEKKYGWTSEQAIGSISHNLLKTKFPCPLNQINDSLRDKGFWEGELIHTKSDGSIVRVRSRWELKSESPSRPPVVRETNSLIVDAGSDGGIYDKTWKSVAALTGMFQDHMLDLPVRWV